MLIHPTQRREAIRAFRGVVLLLAGVIVVLALPASLKARHVPDYLALHMALETAAIVVSALIFGVAWSARHESLTRNVKLLGAAFLGVAILDLCHTLSARGMPAFVTPSSSGKAIYFWLAARALAALALVAVAWLPWKRNGARWRFLPLVVIALALVAGVNGWYFAHPQRWPRVFVPGTGPTPFKVTIEYALVALYLLAAARLAWEMRRPRTFNAGGLFAAACILAESGFFFTTFTSVSDVNVLVGHIYKVFAYVYLFRAVFVETVREPYALLRDSRQQLRATLDALPDLLFEMDENGRYLEVHTGRPDELSVTTDKLIGRTVYEALPRSAAETAMAAIEQARAQGLSRGKVIATDVLAGGKRWFELSVARKPVPAGQGSRFIVISRDVTERRHASHELVKFSSAVAQSPISIIITDLAGHIEFVNEAFTRSSGYSVTEAMGQDVHELLKSGKTPDSTFQEMWTELRSGRLWRGEFINLTKAGSESVQAALVYPLRDPGGDVSHYISLQQDITEKKQAAARIHRLSHYDTLTGLPNRALLYEYFTHANRGGSPLAALWIDVDRFKDVNDALGHNVGDLLLQEAARRLHANLRAEDMLSRPSGDEFVVIARGAEHAAAADLARKLLVALAQPMQLAGRETFVTISIGIALCPDDAAQLDPLLGHAEAAAYSAKDAGRNGYRFFSAEVQRRATRTLVLANALRQAQRHGELYLLYQPQVAFGSGRIVGAEALLRWESPQLGVVSPGEFIPIAETNGLVVPIGEWVLQTALRQLRAWLDRGMLPITLAVNLSAVQFDQPGLAARIGMWLERTGAPAECLELELTEAVAMKTPEVAARKIEALGRRRIRFAIDDFGTGYSSLGSLKHFRIDKLKIDQSFVRDIDHDPRDQAITTAIIEMAHGLGMRAIAEGVETATQARFLTNAGCDEMQGFYCSRPLGADEFEAFVQARAVACPGVLSDG